MNNNDQASGLRLIVKNANIAPLSKTSVIAVTSGKGGVGKSNITANLAIALSQLNKKVLVMDADLGLANIDVLLGLMPKYNLRHVILGEKTVDDILIDGPSNIKIIPGASGITELADLDDYKREQIINNLSVLENRDDYVLIDTGAGLSKNVRRFVTSSNEAIIVTTPDPAAITDAYSMIKVVADENEDLDIKLIVNMAGSEREAEEIAERMKLVVKQFLSKNIEYLGHILMDSQLKSSVRCQKPVILENPEANSAKCIKIIAKKIAGTSDNNSRNKKGLVTFLARLMKRSPDE